LVSDRWKSSTLKIFKGRIPWAPYRGPPLVVPFPNPLL